MSKYAFEIHITDNSGEIMRAFEKQLHVALEAVGTQAESHAKQIITDYVVYGNDGGIRLPTKYYEKDTSRVDTGRLRNSVAHAVIEHECYIGTNLEYAPYHELGTGIYATQAGGRQTPWKYQDRYGKWHTTRGLYPIHFLKRAAANYSEEYKAIIEQILKGE